MESLNFEINSVNIWKINKGRENESLGKCKLKMKKKWTLNCGKYLFKWEESGKGVNLKLNIISTFVFAKGLH